MRTLLAALFAIPLILGAPALADAAGKNKNKGKSSSKPSKGQSEDISTGALLATIITAAERVLIGDYVRQAKASPQGLPSGLAGRPLSPGLQKHIDRTGRLPPGLEKRRLPSGLLGQLPPRTGQDYRVVGNDIVLIEIATGLILDIIQGALR